MILEITNNLTKKTYQLPLTEPSFDRLFLNASVQLPPDMDDGEYTYFLTDENQILAQGLLQIGDYVQEDKITYNSSGDTNEFIQYNG